MSGSPTEDSKSAAFQICPGAVFIILAISKCYGKVRVLFFPRDNSLISRGNSHVSRVRGLVVRCLLFNPEVSCSNPWLCASFFTSIPKQKVLTFIGTMRLFGFVRLFFGFVRLFFGFVRLFFEIF